MKSPTTTNQAKDLAAAVFTSLRGLVSNWNREPSEQGDDRKVINALYSRKRRSDGRPDPF